MNSWRLLLISGAIGSGKSSVAEALQTIFGFSSIQSGAYLRTMSGQGSRKILQDLGDKLDEQTDYKWIVDDVALPNIQANLQVSNWLLDSVRKRRQIDHFRERFGNSIRHVHLFAPEEVLLTRNASRDGAGGAPSYTEAVRHNNEASARALGEVADASFDSSVLTVQEIALAVMNLWREST